MSVAVRSMPGTAESYSLYIQLIVYLLPTVSSECDVGTKSIICFELTGQSTVV